MLTINCGYPDYFDLPETILQGYEVKTIVPLPNLFDSWSDFCEAEIKILNDPSIDFLTFSFFNN
jgi:hypothetical protein